MPLLHRTSAPLDIPCLVPVDPSKFLSEVAKSAGGLWRLSRWKILWKQSVTVLLAVGTLFQNSRYTSTL